MIRKIIFPLILILIGLTQIFGFVIKDNTIMRFGYTYAASPLPVVFTKIGAIEPFSIVLSANYITSNGQTKHIDISPGDFDVFPGPFFRRSSYTSPVFGLITDPTNKRALNVLRFGLCDEGVLIKTFTTDTNIQSAEIIARSLTRDVNAVWKFEVNCQNEISS
ncbi:MAG: hypothetical protein COT81_02315 [Candidatus Buchananbacteria bacterium CG10_big_fil_rev_8_21_14_0_10_42_9]|uniref:Uncharacterized protein n=1 Tax=Candidatus Buchananbacteria bacterium CG10_big_fil_rev_8_21_14_0_10_42_9 TaxID=1974526 RepID=A0A2H0W1I8_9BACT|nr:MAG: hypothetical protein COT81_02315 [Candidatus Buchananbacteria bacterium CG10_big_fil_rev_8_21_14_0_10_42_9]